MKLLCADSDDVCEWEVEYEPIIEIHMAGKGCGRRKMTWVGVA